MLSTTPELWWAFVVGTIVFITLGIGIIATILLSQRRFITVQRGQMEALRKSQSQYKDLFDNISDSVYIHSLDGKLLRVNPAITDFLGHDEEDLLGRSLTEFISTQYHPDLHHYLREINKKGEISGIVHLCDRDGTESLFEYRSSTVKKNGTVLAVRGIARNVTAQKRAQQALKESEERFRKLVSFSPVPIAVHSRWKWVYANDAALDLIGAHHENEVIGKPILFFITHSCRDKLKQDLRTNIFRKQEVSILESGIQRLDGEFIELEIVAMPVSYARGHAGQVVIRDITASKRLQEQLGRAQRLETAGRVAGQIAHDFNNLLAPLTAYPTLIREDIERDHPSVQMIDEMETAAEKIAEINQQLLALGRRGHYSMEPIDLNKLIKKILSTVTLPPDIVLNCDFDPELCSFSGGNAQLTRAFINLIMNAVEAMQSIGTLSIRTRNVSFAEPVLGYQTIDPGHYVILEIADTGSGIEPEVVDKIFEPFFTTKKMDRMRGSGLGLSIVHGVLQDHEGYIALETAVGTGTTFALYFPALSENQSVAQKPNGFLRGQGESILLVDDDSIQRNVGGRLLKRLGYHVVAVSSGEEAIAYLKTHSADLLLLDMVMEGIDGAETYRQILEHNKYQKAIIISGYAMSQRVEEAQRLGAGMFVSKPISPDSLASAIRKELDRETPGNHGVIARK